MLTKETFNHALRNLLQNPESSNFLLAVSGGADSMALLQLFYSLELKLQVAHVNYHLRGADSDADQQLVQDFCSENNIPFHLYEVSDKDQKPENSIQNWARNLRYDFFRKIQKTENLDYLVTAHHLNDQLETFLINLSKASGIHGLSGIPANENQILRPLLNFTKDEIYAFAEANNLEFREDVSNQKNEYLRNFIRNEIAPKLFETNENFLQNFAKSLNFLNQTKRFVEEKIQQIERELVSEKDHVLYLNKAKFAEQDDLTKFEILRKFGFQDEKEIAKIFNADKGKTFNSAEFQLLVDRENFVFIENTSNQNSTENSEEIIIAESLSSINNRDISLSKWIINENETHWVYDEEKLIFPLKLRKKKRGDLILPIGMIGKKTVSKFFKDEKIPILARQKIWLLCNGNDEVMGILPHRQDRRFSANQDTKSTIKIKF
ncbi:tRNA lysidine(34) synthetase TilS [Kaistella haifensis DSM 19056]|uniref:tRNA(Ile)-lysidine synthase n=1 Tax=Kaistella haifensis DSM 19056 TaxID=1450526 RepID=A0A246BB93_9FLAO|nr:tRNA lysidine(34) synthetase TilS [Kaistella haifensis]OWK98659.1 tRNA lysidine(34) synthetase TilS [Kaistella haifensis DSM 19056]